MLLALHMKGIAHRDVKPHNFMITSEQQQQRQQHHSSSEQPYNTSSHLSSSSSATMSLILMDLGSSTKAIVEIKTKRDANLLEEEAAWKTSAGRYVICVLFQHISYTI